MTRRLKIGLLGVGGVAAKYATLYGDYPRSDLRIVFDPSADAARAIQQALVRPRSGYRCFLPASARPWLDWPIERIRERYPLDEELFLNRIATGVLAGLYQYQPGEEEEVLAFGVWAEESRQWGRQQRAALGL